ncbi:hypothetical protein DPMN_046581 [Dreissena polymorpha]|uniref:Uncharacterized protein n=1 Tax=Dreissena polymorpha TaxID=45954 RepID=A0A9D4D660_DREPO|nr:hypothetical protein DPMN_046581 [Dreissena polymorpha]
MEKKTGHYSVRNVNKRDKRALKNLMLLRKSECTKTLLTRKVPRLTAKNTRLRNELNDLKVSLTELKKQNETMETKYADLLGRFNSEKDKKLLAQKSNSYLMKINSDLLQKTTDRQCESLFELETCKVTI